MWYGVRLIRRVRSFLLGIGDRHLDNLMLSTSGKLFHVDFE